MNRFRTWAICGLAAVSLGIAAPGPAAAQVLPTGPRVATIRAAGSYPGDHISTQAMQRFASGVATTTAGQLKVDIVPDAGTVEQLVQELQTGDAAIIWVDLAGFSRFAPELRALTLPFVMPNRERAFQVVEGPVVDLINVWLRARNFVVLGYMDAGASPLFSVTGPIRTIEDLQGLRIGVRDEIRAQAYRIVGAEPTVMPTAEAFAALEQGRIQALEAPYTALTAGLPQQVQGHITGITPIVDYIIVVAGRERWNRMTIDHQRITQLTMRNAITWERGATVIAEEAARSKLVDRGIPYEVPSPELDQRLWGAAAGVVDEARQQAGAEFVNAIIAEAR